MQESKVQNDPESKFKLKDFIVDTYIQNTEYILSNEFWDVVDSYDRARIRACLVAANEKLSQMDKMEQAVKGMLQE